ncbi:MAG: YdcF family protein [Pseudomonadota bacterium]
MLRRFFFGLIFIGLAWLIGLAAFIATLPQPTGKSPASVDAVIVYTGGGGQRISAGMSLLADGAGERLLISGVNRETSRGEIAAMWGGAPAQFDCCVDLGFEAETTQGNAGEAASWAARHNARAVILVTSDYHMPRALAETRAQMPNAKITPFIVASGYLDADGLPVSGAAWKNLAGEYTKFLLAKVKGVAVKLGV